MPFAQESDVIARTLHLCSVVLDGFPHRSIRVVVAFRHTAMGPTVCILADTSTLLGVEAVCFESVMLKTVDCIHLN